MTQDHIKFSFNLRLLKSTMVYCVLMLVIFTQNLHSQAAERSIFRFLTLPVSARASALGGPLSSTLSPDIDMIIQNPAFLNEQMVHSWSASIDNRIAGINRSMLQTAFQLKRIGIIGVHIQHMHYGQLERRNEIGAQLGTFTPYDFQMSVIHSYKIDRFVQIGMGLHWLQSRYGSFNTTALSTNGGIHYKNSEMRNSIGLVFGHVGSMINTLGSKNESLPFEVRLGYSQRLQYLPFEWHLSYRFINKWQRLLPNEQSSEIPIIQMLGRHLVFGGELSLGKALQFRFSYDPWRNQNLNYGENFDFTGTALGLGLRFKRFDLNIARRIHTDLGAEWHIGLISKLK